MPNDLQGIYACFSPGVGSVSLFEKELAELGIRAFLADGSIDSPTKQHKLFHFTKKFVGAFSNDDYVTLDEWVSASVADPSLDLLLQIDIEGNEYQVFLSASEAVLQRFRIIVAEFHRLDDLWNKSFFNLASCAFDKILKYHTCVHIHPNNADRMRRNNGIDIPRVMEFTFLRKDRISNADYQRTFPHRLDCENLYGGRPLLLPACWYKDGR